MLHAYVSAVDWMHFQHVWCFKKNHSKSSLKIIDASAGELQPDVCEFLHGADWPVPAKPEAPA